MVKHLSGHICQVHGDIPIGSPLYKKILKGACSAKTGNRQNKLNVNEEVTNDAEPSERPSADEECAITEAAEEAYSSNVEEEIRVMSSFCIWLQSAYGGRKDKKLSKQHGLQLLRILKTIDPSQQFQSLFNKTLLGYTFLKQAEKKYTADTMRAYLLSLRHLCTYVIEEKPASVDVDPVLLCQIQEKARLWSMSFRKDSKRRHLEKMMIFNLVTPEQINEYECSEVVRSAIAYLEHLSETHSLQVNQSVYTIVRNFILLEITFANMQRLVVSANMTMQEYEKERK